MNDINDKKGSSEDFVTEPSEDHLSQKMPSISDERRGHFQDPNLLPVLINPEVSDDSESPSSSTIH